MDKRVLEAILERRSQGRNFVVASLVRVRGSVPQRPGARLLVDDDGALTGTIGGGCLEMEARRRALDLLGEPRADVFELRLDDDFGWDDGLICGGSATVLLDGDTLRQANLATNVIEWMDTDRIGNAVSTHVTGPTIGTIETTRVEPGSTQSVWNADNGTLLEPVLPEPVLVVCGCGHVGSALVRFASQVGFRTVAVDDRPEYADPARLPWATEVVCDDPARVACDWPSDARTYWAVVTRGHRNDGRVLAGLVGRPSAYVGMIGSRRKIRMIREGLVREGASVDAVARIHAPIGIDIGAQTPEEIALAIAAELVAVRRLGSSAPLRPG